MPENIRRQATISPVTPHFFKIIIDKTLRDNKLPIPKKFMRLYGKSLSNSVRVKLPCGSEWEMEVVESEGRVWLGKGWERFTEHYSIEQGHMICFRYEGDSRFEAVIFDMSTVEIDYPCKRRNCEGFCVGETRKRFRSPCSRDGKRRRMSSDDESKIDACCSEPKGRRCDEAGLQGSERKGGFSSFDWEMEGKPDLGFTDEDECKMSPPRTPNLSEKSKYEYKNSSAFVRASRFTSGRPFFKVIMHRHYVKKYEMNIPRTFARKHFKNNSTDIILKVRNGRNKNETWPVRQKLAPPSGNRPGKATFSSGWREFARANNLEIGDVCVFVLCKGLIDFTFEVVIFRINRKSKPSYPSGTTHVDQCENYSASPVKTEPGVEREENVTSAENEKLPRRAHCEPKKPFFKQFIQQSYTASSECSCLPIPLDFVRKHFKKNCNITLRVPNHGSWTVLFKLWRSKKCKRVYAKFSGGWRVFAERNNLSAGDLCIFYLVDKNEISFEVSIIHIPKANRNPQQIKEENDSKSEDAIEIDSKSDDAIEIDSKSEDAIENDSKSDDAKTREYSFRGSSHPQVSPMSRKALNVFEKTEVLERTHFRSKKPFFKVVVQPSYTGNSSKMPIPYEFVQKHIKEDKNATLHVKHATKSWPVQIKLKQLKSGRLDTTMCSGWKTFAVSNNLEVGDVCIFELKSKTNFSFDVSIVRARVDNARKLHSRDGDPSKGSNKVQRVTRSAKIEID